MRSFSPFWGGQWGLAGAYFNPNQSLGKKCSENSAICLDTFFHIFQLPLFFPLFLLIRTPSSCFDGKVTTWAWGLRRDRGEQKKKRKKLPSMQRRHGREQKPKQNPKKETKLKTSAASATVPPIFACSIFAGPHVLPILRIVNRGALGHINQKAIYKTSIFDAGYTLPTNHIT